MSKINRHKPKQIKLEGPLLIGSSTLTDKDLTKSQQKATKLFDTWFKSRDKKKKRILRIGGYPGTGKTT